MYVYIYIYSSMCAHKCLYVCVLGVHAHLQVLAHRPMCKSTRVNLYIYLGTNV